jgi:hypothetical protein
MKPCEACKHYRVDTIHRLDFEVCDKGPPGSLSSLCHNMREFSELDCGPEGKLWEAK